MSVISSIFRPVIEFLSSKTKRCLLLIGILAIAALTEFFILGLARRTFVFYTAGDSITVSDNNITGTDNNNNSLNNNLTSIIERITIVEDRMLKRSRNREINIIRYTEETLLGPAAPDLLPLFPRETRLKSLLYRDGVVFINLSEEAALPPVLPYTTTEVSLGVFSALLSFRTLYDGILRNFSYVRDVRFFIDGQAAYTDVFQKTTINPES
jgi:hypothetical protein